MSFTYKGVIKKIKDLTTIMILDEDLKLLDVIKHYLSQQQFHVITENSIEIGIKKLKQIQPDIIILDTNIKQKTKKTVLQELKREKKLKNLPFIFLTAKGMTKDRIQGYTLGCSAYLTKPFDPAELVAIIENILTRNKCIQEVFEITKKIKQIRKEIETQYYLKQSLRLTPREKTVLKGVISGLSNIEIAFKCKTSKRNIEKYVTRLLEKTKTKNRTELTKFMYGIPKYYYTTKADDGNRTRE
jgi:DNA-binding NarL/FixJ family response regulator